METGTALFAALATVGALLVIGPVIAAVLYWMLLNDIRKAIREVRCSAGDAGSPKSP